MPRAGRPKTPTTLKLLHGTHRADRHGAPESEPKPLVADMAAPPDLGHIGRQVWASESVRLQRLGLLTELDRIALGTYCRAHEEIAKCDAVLAEAGEDFETDKGYVGQHPAVNRRFKWLDIKRRYEIEFGMTPSSRSGLQVSGQGKAKVASRKRA